MFEARHFPTTPLIQTGDPAEDGKLRLFGAWVAGEADFALGMLRESALPTPIALEELLRTLFRRRHEKAVADGSRDAPKFGRPISEGNIDFWGYSAELLPPAQRVRAEAGELIRNRLGFQTELTQMWPTLAGEEVAGVTLYGGEAAKAIYEEKAARRTGRPYERYEPLYLTSTARPEDSRIILHDTIERWCLAIRLAGQERSEALRQLILGIQGYFQGLPINRGGDAVGRAIAAAVFAAAFGRPVILPGLVDVYAYVLCPEDFLARLSPVLKP